MNTQKVIEAYHILKSISQCHKIFQHKRYPSRNSHIWFLLECCCFGSRTIWSPKQKQIINWDIETRMISLWMIFLSEISLEFSLANRDSISDRSCEKENFNRVAQLIWLTWNRLALHECLLKLPHRNRV